MTPAHCVGTLRPWVAIRLFALNWGASRREVSGYPNLNRIW